MKEAFEKLRNKLTTEPPEVVAMREEIAAYRKLQDVAVTDEFDLLAERLTKTVVEKMIYAFTNDNAVKSMDDFYKLRGEIIARMQPLQDIGQAQLMADQLETRLKEFYTPQA